MVEIYQALIIFAVAFIATYIMVPLSKRIAIKIGAIDYPGNRRLNSEPVPRCGGIALYVGLIAAVATIAIGVKVFGWRVPPFDELHNTNVILLLVGVSFMFVVGLVDDVTQLSPIAKFGGQVISAVLVALSGIAIDVIRSPFDNSFVELSWLAIPITVVYLVIFVNITNLIDGLDGLAAGIVAIVASGLLYLTAARGSVLFALICIALIGVCVAFLRFNFAPASVFMGDSGSLLLGLMIGIVSISGVARTQSLIVMLVPLVMAGVPLLDTISAVIRRTRGHQPVQKADMGHIHHRLMDAGWGQRKSVLILYACTAILAIVGCMLSSMSGQLSRWIVLIALAAVLFLIIWRFGLFKPVLKHYYDNKGGRGPRTPKNKG